MNVRQHSEQPESINNTCVVEKVDSNVIPDSADMCNNDDIQTDQNAEECDDERAALANLIANLTLDTKENKRILKKLKKANASLTQELKECKSNLEESNTTRDSCLIVLQNKQNELETYKTLIDHTVDYDKLERTIRFGNDQFAPILGYGDLVQGNITINKVYYVGGLNHNLFSFGQFCDADLEVDFRKSTCFIRDLQGNNLLTGNRGSDLYTISLQETTSSTPICFMAKASPTQAWLWHRRLSHLNFDYINLLSKKDIVIGLPKL
ncbi:retrovirus-related pol polyprotein from transposon TNT 1-94 [Tanacetum coccineum]|uniref:Retrovirus-related pol polyprotein from transposon TNT 1-94 n=1 Tax=Tanacetum coccineum TaxID=301880 RepID=A0ABQ4WFJ9_9ASTR